MIDRLIEDTANASRVSEYLPHCCAHYLFDFTFPKLASDAGNSIHTATSLPLSMYSEHLSPDVPSLPQHSFNMAKKPSSLFGLEGIAFACCLQTRPPREKGLYSLLQP